MKNAKRTTTKNGKEANKMNFIKRHKGAIIGYMIGAVSTAIVCIIKGRNNNVAECDIDDSEYDDETDENFIEQQQEKAPE